VTVEAQTVKQKLMVVNVVVVVFLLQLF